MYIVHQFIGHFLIPLDPWSLPIFDNTKMIVHPPCETKMKFKFSNNGIEHVIRNFDSKVFLENY